MGFERNVERDNELRVSGGRDRIPESWSNDRKGLFTQRCLDIIYDGVKCLNGIYYKKGKRTSLYD